MNARDSMSWAADNGLSQKIVVVVGASSGIGLAVARRSAFAGADVVMVSRSRTKLDEAAARIGAEMTPAAEARGERTPGGLVPPRVIDMDMLDPSAVDRHIGAIARIDHLVLTAVADELASRAPIAELTNEQLERTFDKLRGFTNVVRASVPRIDAHGSIVLLAGVSAVRPPKQGFSALAAASGAISSFGKALALELSPRRVNVIMSGIVDTPIHGERREEMKAWAERDLPAKRFGQPDDIAHAVAFAMTNPYLTGETIIVDGGFVQV